MVDDATANGNGRVENSRNAATMKQTPASMSTAQAAQGKGRGGEHKTMMHKH